MSQTESEARAGYVTWDEISRIIDAQRRDRDEIKQRLAILEAIVAPEPKGGDYTTLNREQKANHLRSYMVHEASKHGGKHAVTYREVKGVFDGQLSTGNYYQIMERAAAADGFTYNDAPDGNRRLTLDLNDVGGIHE